ncbi:virulence factor TspB C-terminal domain-related protein [Ectopseudomonas mendocina]|uniref:virulence factor TspB C-terminal domain-related protein n=1 Tax=Ectopseudomonas mendocina TaxID=300 RepID=UPI000206DDB3|nr:virulence factor TspB C-terminal domain-related protein [Pseudomonas mendocina]AEB59214.1 hypothetical protein MDS_3183 [Pseudomonas mendocina NK-01]
MAQAFSRHLVHALMALVLLTLAATANAATKITYYYGKQGDWITSRKKNPDAACMAILSESPEVAKYKHVAALGAAGSAGGACIGDLPTGTRGEYGYWVSTTVTCDHGSADGLTCNPPPEPSACESKAGNNFAFMASPPEGQLSLPGEYICDSGCRATWNSGSNGGCANNNQGIRACFGIGTYTGGDCQTGDIPTGTGTPPPDPTDPTTPTNPTDPTDPTDPVDPTDPSNNCGPGHSWSGTTCVPTNPTDPSNPSNPGDGGGDDGSTGGGNNGGGGNVGGIGGGDGDGNGDGSGSGDGDGNGSGTGNSGEGDDGEGDNEEGNASVSGESCTAELACEGDVIQCAILRKNKEQVCQWKYDSEAQGQVESALSGPEYQLQDQDIPVSGLFNDALNKGRWLPQSCPAPQTFSVMGRSYSFSWEPACRFALAIGPLIVALASIFFAVTIARGIKGS